MLALRSKVKSGGWLRLAAKHAGVPVFSVKRGDQLENALRTLLGIYPAPGGAVLRPSAQQDTAEASPQDITDEALPDIPSTPRTDDISVTTLREAPLPQARQYGGVASQREAESHSEALEEARIAVESIVLPRQQPIELMPRAEDVVEAQVWYQHGHANLAVTTDYTYIERA